MFWRLAIPSRVVRLQIHSLAAEPSNADVDFSFGNSTETVFFKIK
jgi:hypothetical protein